MILGLNISTPEITVNKDGVSLRSLKNLKPGQLIRAKVLGMLTDTRAQLLIGGQKLTADTGVPLAPGQELQLKLIREKGQLSFKLMQTPQPRAVSVPKGGTAPPEITVGRDAASLGALKGFKPGQLVQAKVLGMLSDTRTQLLVGGQKLTADTGVPLTPGQELQLKLIQEKGGVSFKLLQAPPPPSEPGPQSGVSLARVASGILSFEKLGEDPGPVLGKILDGLALKSGERDEGFLPRLLQNSGLMLEKKIATLLFATDGAKPEAGMQKLAGQDLKAAVLQMLSKEFSADDADPVAGKSQTRALARSVASALENFQTLNTQPSDTQRFILPFPVLAGDQFNFGQLFLDTGKKGEQGEGDADNRVTRLAFLLDMTSLGSLRADFSILKKNLTGRFLLQEQSTCDYLSSLVPVLGQRLAAIGFQMGRVDCCVAEPSQLSPGALIQSMTDDSQVRGLNLVI